MWGEGEPPPERSVEGDPVDFVSHLLAKVGIATTPFLQTVF